MRSRPVVVAAVVALACALAGCTPAAPHGSASPSESVTPVFASDADALKAAETAYAAYLKVSDEVGQSGGADPDRLAPFVTKSRLKTEESGAKLLQEHAVHTSGTTRFDGAYLQSVSSDKDLVVTFYACWDATDVRIISQSGNDVTPSDRQNRQQLAIVMKALDGKLPLVLDSDDSWSQSSC